MLFVYIDPPNGWGYDFPKLAPANYDDPETFDLNSWLIQQGYPKRAVEYWVSIIGAVPVTITKPSHKLF